jgi:alpha-tubulin suppressor-like RCC1 family protein
MRTWLQPKLMTVLKKQKIVDVACGLNFSGALSDDGLAFTWGKGGGSALGHGDRESQAQPVLVEALASNPISTLVAGPSVMAALTKK